jgi:hypothetical protein
MEIATIQEADKINLHRTSKIRKRRKIKRIRRIPKDKHKLKYNSHKLKKKR